MENASSSMGASAQATVPTLELLGRSPITYESALETDANMIHEAGYVAATKALYVALWRARPTLEALTRHHLSLSSRDICTVARPIDWIRGGFNVCIPVEVQSTGSCRKFMIRCAMPHKLAEAKHPGTVNEKVACEVGTYVWMQEKCRDIPIPRLYGFGFSDHRHFTHEAHRPWYIRVLQYLRRTFHGLMGFPGLVSRYTSHATAHQLPTAYMLLEHVGSDTSQMLSITWAKQRGNPVRRQTLFRSMAHLMLSLARVPQPQIGSFRFYDDGTIKLTNRPLTCTLMLLENDGTPRTIPKDMTYSCIEPYIADVFRFHDQRFLSHPNAVYDEKDCRGELAAKVLLRALAHRYVRQDQRNGPFFLQFDDLHSSNVFVDEEWNITHLVDLEWVCALPVERMNVPYWLTGRDIGGLQGEYLAEFETVREEFMRIFEEEEPKVAAEHGLSLTQVMHETWKSGSTWFWYSLTSTNAMYSLFTGHIRPRFADRLLFREEELLSKFWSEGAATVVETKVDEYHKYEEDLKQLFC